MFEHKITTEFGNGQRVNHEGTRVNYTTGWAQWYESEDAWIYNPEKERPRQVKSLKITSIIHDDHIAYFCAITPYWGDSIYSNFSVDPWIIIRNNSMDRQTNLIAGDDVYWLLKFIEPSWADAEKTCKRE